jgi:RHS repeat-associated protein
MEEEGSTPDAQKGNSKDEDSTGLLNEGFRYRDLAMNVFLARDPAGFVDGPNLYTYVRQNPWSKFDPEGLQGYRTLICRLSIRRSF